MQYELHLTVFCIFFLLFSLSAFHLLYVFWTPLILHSVDLHFKQFCKSHISLFNNISFSLLCSLMLEMKAKQCFVYFVSFWKNKNKKFIFNYACMLSLFSNNVFEYRKKIPIYLIPLKKKNYVFFFFIPHFISFRHFPFPRLPCAFYDFFVLIFCFAVIMVMVWFIWSYGPRMFSLVFTIEFLRWRFCFSIVFFSFVWCFCTKYVFIETMIFVLKVETNLFSAWFICRVCLSFIDQVHFFIFTAIEIETDNQRY